MSLVALSGSGKNRHVRIVVMHSQYCAQTGVRVRNPPQPIILWKGRSATVEPERYLASVWFESTPFPQFEPIDIKAT